MSNIQTGSHGEVRPLPRRDPWASFALHGMPPENPYPHADPPPWILPARRRIGWRGVLAAFGATVLALASCGTPAPAAPRSAGSVAGEAAARTALTVVSVHGAATLPDWSMPRVTPAAQRRIEVVDRIAPTAWRVGAAAEWLDRYTASNMVAVAKCSGKAYRCVTVRGGKLPGNLVGWAKGSTITIDTAKVARSPYRSATYRQRLLAHELAHTFGLHHAGGRNLMATTVDRMHLVLTAGQRAHLRTR